MKKITRRKALRNLAILTGGSLTASTVAGVMAGCQAESGTGYSAASLSDDQFELVTVISDLIIPETETPGAKAAGVPSFIDKMITDWNTETEKNRFVKGLKDFQNENQERYNKDFTQLSRQQQFELLDEIDVALFSDGKVSANNDLHYFFKMMKEFTVIGYYTSEIGATQELNINLVPGYYDACVPYTEIGKAWA